MEYCLVLNPTIDKTVEVRSLEVGGTNRAQSVRRDAGGKGVNVALVLKALGGNPKVVGVNSADNGDIINDALERASIFYDFHKVASAARVNTKIVDEQSGITTELNEPGEPVDPDLLVRIADELADSVRDGDTVILSGALPPQAQITYYGNLVERLKKRKISIVIDSSGKALAEAAAAGPTMIKPNLSELEMLAGRKLSTIGNVRDAADELIGKSGIGIVLVTMGPRGMLITDGTRNYYAAAVDGDVKSTVGAGDAAVAGAVAELGGPLDAVLHSAAAASAAVVRTEGTQPCTREQFDAVYAQIAVQENIQDIGALA